MKNQYFGDRRDFFKYDLVLTLSENIELLNDFTYILMLTENDSTTDGNITQYEGNRRKDLKSFLRSCLVDSDRNIQNLKAFMDGQSIDYFPYKDTEYFYNQSRADYFNGIETGLLSNAVVLFDPDIGLEVKNMKKRNMYLRYNELNRVFERTTDSLVVVYQHIAREQRLPYFTRISNKIKVYLNVDKCICVSDNEIVFFIVSKNSELITQAWGISEDYAKRNQYIACFL